MRVLLTGASGLVGSHVADALVAAGISTRLLLRANSSTQFLTESLPKVEIAHGGIDQPACLPAALDRITAARPVGSR